MVDIICLINVYHQVKTVEDIVIELTSIYLWKKRWIGFGTVAVAVRFGNLTYRH